MGKDCYKSTKNEALMKPLDSFYREAILSSKNFKDRYLSNDYENYIVEYIGNIFESINKIDYASILSGLSNFAIITVKKGMVRTLLKDVPEIINIEKSYAFLISELESNDSTYSYNTIDKQGVPFNGQGVIVGIIGTGIDYLNERFMTADKKSRVVAIWDQTLEQGTPPKTLMYGAEFNKADIDSAINEKLLERDPYKIVAHRDETGEGTAIAGVVGARKLSLEDKLEGVAPNCEFAIVKLKEAKKSTLEENYLVNTQVKVYESTDIGLGIRYLADLQNKLKKPMVVYVPLGNNCSGHDGSNALERYMEIFVNKKGFILTANTGSEGDGESHTSGNLTKTGDMKTIDLEIDKEEKAFCVSIWITKPSKVSIGIILPNGERIDKISSPSLDEKEEIFQLNNIEIKVQFFIQQQTGGEQVIFILAKGDVGGVWQINLFGDYVVEGRYDAWLQQKRLRKIETKFLNTDSYVTLMIPSTSENIIATTYYNQENNTLDLNAGNGFTRDDRIKPSVTVGAKEILTVGRNNTLTVSSGAAIAGGILSGVVALLLEWGIVEGNDLNLYSSKVNIYLIRGTKREKEIVYPNPQWGYGVLDIQELFKGLTRNSEKEKNAEEFQKYITDILKENIVTNIPIDLYKRLG